MKKAMLQEFLSLRASGSTDVSKWSKMLEENFILVLPITPYRSFPPDEVGHIS